MIRRSAANVARGFAMGAADLVPGVSGGTVALVTGIYHDLVGGIRSGVHAGLSLVRFDISEARRHLLAVPWALLVPLAAGLAAAVLLLTSTIEHLLDTEPVRMAALFFGLVVGSIVVARRLIGAWEVQEWTALGATAAVTFVALGFRSGEVQDPALWMFLCAGSIAICAMILPGVSGSFLLLALGMYEAVISAVSDRDLVPVGVFFLGCVVGLAVFSNVLHWALEKWSDLVMAALIGLMVGSLRVLWPWPDGTGEEQMGAPEGDVWVPVALGLVGFAVVVGFSAIARRFEPTPEAELRSAASA